MKFVIKIKFFQMGNITSVSRLEKVSFIKDSVHNCPDSIVDAIYETIKENNIDIAKENSNVDLKYKLMLDIFNEILQLNNKEKVTQLQYIDYISRNDIFSGVYVINKYKKNIEELFGSKYVNLDFKQHKRFYTIYNDGSITFEQLLCIRILETCLDHLDFTFITCNDPYSENKINGLCLSGSGWSIGTKY